MFDGEVATDEIKTTMTLGEAADAIRPLVPGAKVKEVRRCVAFELDGDGTPWAMVSVFDFGETLVEARYLAGADDSRCRRLREALRGVFGGTEVAAEPEDTSFRGRLLGSLRGLREGGIRIRRLAFGAPASAETIARIERDHLGFAMPEALRAFFEAHDGVSVLWHKVADPAAEITDHTVPLDIESEAPMTWSEAMHDGGPIWKQIDESDYGRAGDGGFYFAGLACIPPLAVMFDTDWGSIHGWPKGLYLFDAWHAFHGTALVVDRDAREVYIKPTSDYGADRDAAPVELADYLDTLAKTAGSDRVVDGRHVPVRSHG